MRNKKKFLIAFIFIFIFFILYEAVLYIEDSIKANWFPSYNLIRPEFTLDNIDYYMPFRKPCGLDYKKPPILLYGCSFTYGEGLKEDEHFGHFLSKYTHRPVYNFGTCCSGLQHSLYILQNQRPVEPQPEYIMYVFISDHIRRLYATCRLIDEFKFLEYEKKDGEMVVKKDLINFLKNTMVYQSFISYFLPKVRAEKKFDLFKFYLKEIKKEAYKRYPNAKFVFILYERPNTEYIDIPPELIKDIKDMGIDVIDLKEVFGDKIYQKEYLLDNTDDHPNAKAWEMIVPEIAKIEKM